MVIKSKSHLEFGWCKTCYPGQSEFCLCEACAIVCHKKHDIVLIERSHYYCDCGVEKKRCKCLQNIPMVEDKSSSVPLFEVEPLSNGFEVNDLNFKKISGLNSWNDSQLFGSKSMSKGKYKWYIHIKQFGNPNDSSKTVLEFVQRKNLTLNHILKIFVFLWMENFIIWMVMESSPKKEIKLVFLLISIP
jgi:hypothetical protein